MSDFIPSDPAAEFDEAQLAYRDGDLHLAVYHLALALSAEPDNLEWLDFLDDLVEETDEPFELLPDDEQSPALDAVRAYFLMRMGELGQSLGILGELASADFRLTYMENWGMDWLEESDIHLLPREEFEQAIGPWLWSIPEATMLRRKPREALGRMLPIIDEYLNYEPDEPSLCMLRAFALRKVGRIDDSITYAQRVIADTPSWDMYIALGSAQRVNGDVSGAITTFRRALRYGSDEAGAWCDIGDMYLDQDNWDAAADAYRRVLEIEAKHDWAYPSWTFCQLQIHDAREWEDELTELAEEENHRALSLIQRFIPYHGFLPEPYDVTANVLRRIIMDGKAFAPSEDVEVENVILEAPSNRVAFETQMKAWGSPARLKIIKPVPTEPDIRIPLAPVEFLVWEYDGEEPVATSVEPGDDIKRMIAELARRPYDPESNFHEAAVVAEQIELSRLDELLGAMTQPPDLEGNNALLWVPRVQIAVAFVVAHMDRGWRGSLRRKVLLDLLLGPTDWITTAAILALTHLSFTDSNAAREIDAAFEKLWNNRQPEHYNTYLDALLDQWRYLPTLSDERRAEVEDRFSEHRWSQHDEEFGEHSDEIRQLSDQINITPSVELYVQRARLFKDCGHYRDAFEDFGAAIQLDPEVAEYYAERGRLLMYIGASEQACDEFDRAIEFAPENEEYYVDRGAALDAMRLPHQALRDLERATKMNPESAEAYQVRASVWLGLGDVARATRDVNRAQQLDADPVEILSLRSGILVLNGQFEEGMTELTRAIELAPNKPDLYSRRGLAYLHNSQYDDALPDLTRAIDMAPDVAHFHSLRGIAFCNLGDYEKAKADLDKALELDPRDVPALINRGELYLQQGDYEAAIADFTQAIEESPGDTSVLHKRGHVFALNGQAEKSIEDNSRAIEIAAADPAGYNNRAWVAATRADTENRDLEQAQSDAMRACELTEFEDHSYLHTLAICYAAADRIDSAMTILERAIEFAPEEFHEEYLSLLEEYRDNS